MPNPSRDQKSVVWQPLNWINSLGAYGTGAWTGRCCSVLAFWPLLSFCFGMNVRVLGFTCCDGMGRRHGGATIEGCFTLGLFVTGSVPTNSCQVSGIPSVGGGAVLTVCPPTGCVLRGCVSCSIGVRAWGISLVIGCRYCSEGPSLLCGVGTGAGTGCEGQVCLTCSLVS